MNNYYIHVQTAVSQHSMHKIPVLGSAPCASRLLISREASNKQKFTLEHFDSKHVEKQVKEYVNANCVCHCPLFFPRCRTMRPRCYNCRNAKNFISYSAGKKSHRRSGQAG